MAGAGEDKSVENPKNGAAGIGPDGRFRDPAARTARDANIGSDVTQGRHIASEVNTIETKGYEYAWFTAPSSNTMFMKKTGTQGQKIYKSNKR